MHKASAPAPDVAIIGGGPAGLASAWKAASLGLQVWVFEPQQRPIDKPCGEGIMPGALDVLDAMGISTDSQYCRPFPGIRYCVPGARPLAIDFPLCGRAYSRPVLDSLLRERLRSEPGVSLIPEKAVAERRSGGFAVSTASGTEANVPYLIVADGAGGKTARWLRGQSRLIGPRLGLRTRHQDRLGLDRVEIHLGQGIDFYMTPLPQGLVNVALLVESPRPNAGGAQNLFAWALSYHPEVQKRLGDQITAAVSSPLQHAYPYQVTDGSVFLVGDAGGVADPILGTGLAVALRTGFQAAEAVAARCRGASALQVAKTFRHQANVQRGPRRKLARLLHFASAHERVTRGAVAVLHRTPKLAQRLAATAAGVPLRAASS